MRGVAVSGHVTGLGANMLEGIAKMRQVEQHYEVVAIDAVKPHPRNPRRGNVDLISESIQENGFYGAIIAQKSSGNIIAGNHRWKAAKASGAEKISVIYIDVDDDRALRIMLADNKASDDASNDDDALADLLRDLQASDEKLAGTLFTEEDLVIDEPADEKRDLPEDLVVAYASFYARLAGMIETSQIPSFTNEASIVHFLRALHGVAEYPRSGSNGFIGAHRLSVPGDKHSLLDGLRDPKTARWRIVVTGGVVSEDVTNSSLAIHGARQPADFPAELARSLMCEFAPPGGRVLDPCHGWGGRGVGFLLSHAGYYLGFDPAPETNACVRKMLSAYAEYTEGKTWDVQCLPFEDGELGEASFDFALTSPPYYDTEQYVGGDQSHLRYHSYSEWVDGFYKPMILKVRHALVPGGTFALQVGSQSYPLAKDGESIARSVGFKVDRRRDSGMVNNYNGTDVSDGEVVLILRVPR